MLHHETGCRSHNTGCDGDCDCRSFVELNAELDRQKRADDEARAARIQQARFERGRMDAQMGEPPTEASSEYQKGYAEGARISRFALPK